MNFRFLRPVLAAGASRVPFALALLFACGSQGCIDAVLADGQISATREASSSFNGIGDYELARTAAQAGMVQLEGMHELRPSNEDALFMLTEGWVSYAYGFPQDEYEEAVDSGDDEAADYHKKRANLALGRAVFFGLELLSHRDGGFAAAKRNDELMKKWLAEHFTKKSDAPNLFWAGYAWLDRVDLNQESPELVADLFIGVDLVERSVALDPAEEHWSGTIALAAYHARPSGEMDQAKQMFDLVLQKTQRRNLMVQLTYAQTYACLKGDRTLYEQLLNEVLASQDPDPEQRLSNTLAKRRAKRFLGRSRMMNCGFDLPAKTSATRRPG
jgi:hypothetical protein